MKHTKEVRVYYHDTDSYGVVWHGSSVKWFEEGRVELCDLLGITIADMEKDGIVFPVVDMHIRYKSSAFFNDILLVETTISEFKQMSVTFSHTVKNKETGKVNIIAETTIVAVDSKNGKLIKHLPEKMINAFKSAING